MGGSTAYSSGNPFSSGVNGTADPFSEHVFDPPASKKGFLDSGKEINQNTIQVSFFLHSAILFLVVFNFFLKIKSFSWLANWKPSFVRR